MLSALCAMDEEVAVLILLALAAGLVSAFFALRRQVRLAEDHVDPNHWAADTPVSPMINFLNQALRFSLGVGYTQAGREVWWDGMLIFLLFAVPFWGSVAFVLAKPSICA